jgi:outer membrane protein assembly factor BamB
MSGGDTPAIIYSGRCYQAITKSVNGVAQYFFQCYDLRTGEVYWENPTVSATFYRYSLGAWGAYQGPLIPSNILYEVAPAAGAAGAEANENVAVYLVATSGGRLYKWDPWTGAMSLNVSIAPLTTAAIYNNEWVVSVQTINATARLYRLINWTMRGSSTNFATRIANNITWPRVEVGSTVDWEKGVAIMAMTNAAIDEALGQTSQNYNLGYFMESVDMRTGAVLFSQRSTELNETIGVTQGPVSDRGKIAFPTWGQHWICFDSRTGKKLWTSEESRYPWGVWWAYATSTYDFNETKGAIFATSYDGIYAIDWDTGKFLWHYTSPEVPFESPYGGVQPFQSGLTMADGKIYVHNCEHSPSEPITRGWSLHCINATTGELIWKIRNPMVPGAVADGYLTASNTYDGYMYVFGKGKSATTVTAPDVAVPLGTAFTIKGTVLDQSPGQPGTPCVSKESMATQMEYLHMQRPIDGLYHNETITGVPVTLTAIGSDGTVIDIGATTSNGYYGAFGISWAPPKEGKYMIMASFAGENSYGSSNAATFVTVGPAVETPETPEIPTPVDYTWTIIGMGIAVIIAVAIVGALLLLKRH